MIRGRLHPPSSGRFIHPSRFFSLSGVIPMHSFRFAGPALVVGLATFGFAACSSDPQEKYVAELRSSNEVPANSSTAVGRVVLLVSRDASYAEYSVEQGGLTGGIR